MIRLLFVGDVDQLPSVGPGRVLTNLAKRAYPDVKFLPVGTAADLDGVLDFLAENNKPSA